MNRYNKWKKSGYTWHIIPNTPKINQLISKVILPPIPKYYNPNKDLNWNRIGIISGLIYNEQIIDIKWRQTQCQKFFKKFSPFCEALDYFFRKWLNYR